MIIDVDIMAVDTFVAHTVGVSRRPPCPATARRVPLLRNQSPHRLRHVGQAIAA